MYLVAKTGDWSYMYCRTSASLHKITGIRAEIGVFVLLLKLVSV